MKTNQIGLVGLFVFVGTLDVACSSGLPDETGTGGGTSTGGKSTTNTTIGTGGVHAGGSTGTGGSGNISGTGGSSGVGGTGTSGGASASGTASGGLSNTGGTAVTGGNANTGGGTNIGGTSNSTGASNAGGSMTTGGATTTGGAANTGGTANMGGTKATVGSTATGGNISTGGSKASGGLPNTGGSIPTGGAVTGGAAATGGITSTGGTMATGGTSSTGGTLSTGGSPNTGGFPATGGLNNLTGGAMSSGGASAGIGGTTSAGASGLGGTAGSGITVPNLLGLAPADAATHLSSAGLAAGTITNVDNPISLTFDSLPSAQGWIYNGDPGFNESDVFSVQGGVLHQDSRNIGGLAAPYYYIMQAAEDATLPFTLDIRSRTIEETGVTSANPYGFTFYYQSTGNLAEVGVTPSRFHVWIDVTDLALDGTAFHDFRIEGQSGQYARYYIDGTLVIDALITSDSFTGQARLGLGDGTRGADALADISSFVFRQPRVTAQNPSAGSTVISGSPVAYTVSQSSKP